MAAIHPLLKTSHQPAEQTNHSAPAASRSRTWLPVIVAALAGSASGPIALLIATSHSVTPTKPAAELASPAAPAKVDNVNHDVVAKRLDEIDEKLKRHRQAIVTTAHVMENLANVLDNADIPGWPVRRIDFTDVESQIDK